MIYGLWTMDWFSSGFQWWMMIVIEDFIFGKGRQTSSFPFFFVGLVIQTKENEFFLCVSHEHHL